LALPLLTEPIGAGRFQLLGSQLIDRNNALVNTVSMKAFAEERKG
jgi:hypothetical protein